jgi:uncharacterized protein (DUF1778 family)
MGRNRQEAVDECSSFLDDDEDLKADTHKIAESREEVRALLARLNQPDSPTPDLDHDAPRAQPPTRRLDLDALVAIRRAHETDRAKRGVRGSGDPTLPARERDDDPIAQRRSRAIRLAAQRYEEILREVNKPSEGSGLDRAFRWTGSVPGNTANALLASGQKADRVRIRV